MYFIALALDYDGTLANEGTIEESTLDALTKVKETGRKLILVTGRRLDDLKQICSRLDLFDRIVAENGALLYNPENETQSLLAKAPPSEFVERLQKLKIDPLMCGNVIVASEKPHETIILKIIKELGLEYNIIFNKDAVMVLPSGVNKASGLAVALSELGLSMHNVIGVGDAENDHAFLQAVGLGVAVANAHASIKENSSIVMKENAGLGVEELIDQLLENESNLVIKIPNKIALGIDEQGNSVELDPLDRVLIAGSSGIGKSTIATALTEKMVSLGLQFCIFDPEGDYERLDNAIVLGDVKTVPPEEQVMQLLNDPTQNVVVNTLGVELKDRPSFFVQLAPKIIILKSHTGRPHWLLIDEAHHLMPAAQNNISISVPKGGIIIITVHPDEIAAELLKTIDHLFILGPQAPDILQRISQIIEEPLPEFSFSSEDDLFLWQRSLGLVKKVKADQPKQQHKRHTRKYVEGDLSDEFCFYFIGPKGTLNLKAQNLKIFIQLSEGVDDATWLYHLKKNDYSNWFLKDIKDEKLAEGTEQIENDSTLSAEESKKAITLLIKELYILTH